MGIYRPLANVMAFSTQSSERMRISAGGLLGVGTPSPTQRLHVRGGMRLEDGLFDGTNSPGSSGQVLTSTGSSTEWSSFGATEKTKVENSFLFILLFLLIYFIKVEA